MNNGNNNGPATLIENSHLAGEHLETVALLLMLNLCWPSSDPLLIASFRPQIHLANHSRPSSESDVCKNPSNVAVPDIISAGAPIS